MLSGLHQSGTANRKKLAEAARLWARGDFAGNDEIDVAEVDSAFASFGLFAEMGKTVERLQFYLWPENKDAWMLFMSCGTQWRVSMGGREGFDYPGVKVVMEMSNIHPRKRSQRFREVQVMESAALQEWAKTENNKQKKTGKH